MIGVLDSGTGGLTVLRALAARLPEQSFLYLGDHANAPYGHRASSEIVAFTRAGVEELFRRGARLVVLGCNTATCIALRALQRDWLPESGFTGCNVIGIVAPTVEAATQTPWAVSKPQYPQKNNRDLIAIFGTQRTIDSGVYPEEIRKRCPRVRVVEQACSPLVAAIESMLPEADLGAIVDDAIAVALARIDGCVLDRAILGCTHFALVERLFRRRLPAATRILSQAEAVADSLEDYLARHPEYAGAGPPGVQLLTTGDEAQAGRAAQLFWPGAPRFARV